MGAATAHLDCLIRCPNPFGNFSNNVGFSAPIPICITEDL
jgi:hypothetical protein